MLSSGSRAMNQLFASAHLAPPVCGLSAPLELFTPIGSVHLANLSQLRDSSGAKVRGSCERRRSSPLGRAPAAFLPRRYVSSLETRSRGVWAGVGLGWPDFRDDSLSVRSHHCMFEGLDGEFKVFGKMFWKEFMICAEMEVDLRE